MMRMSTSVGQQLGLLVVAAVIGCGPPPTPTDPASPDAPERQSSAQTAATDGKTAAAEADDSAEDQLLEFESKLLRLEALVRNERWEEAAGLLAEVQREPPAEESRLVADFQRITAAAAEALAALETEALNAWAAEVDRLIEKGDLQAARTAVDEPPGVSVAAEKRARELKSQIEALAAERAAVAGWVDELAAAEVAALLQAEAKLFRQPGAAAEVLVDRLLANPPPDLEQRYLDLLQRLRQPDAIGQLVERLLADPAPRGDLIAKLARAPVGMATEQALLRGYSAASSAEARQVAAEGLATLPRPTLAVLTTLLPNLLVDSPELPAVLEAVSQSLVVNQAEDFDALRRWEDSAAGLDEQARNRLKARIEELAGSADDAATDRLSKAARRLAVVLRMQSPQPFSGVRLFLVSGEDSDSPAANLIDGQLGGVNPGQQWRHAGDHPPEIVLDLGESRCVAALRILNFNRRGRAVDGWREMEVVVSDDPSATGPAVRAFLPQAPGEEVDYDATVQIPLPLPKGRFIRLRPISTHSGISRGGLNEVQVLGL